MHWTYSRLFPGPNYGLCGVRVMTSIRFRLRKLLGNRSFLDYNPQKFWETRQDGRGIGNEPWLKDLVAFLKEHKCKNILEIGCGTAVNLAYVKKECPRIDCVGFDLSEKHISLGIEKYPDIKLFSCEIKDWCSGQFDCILTAGVLMHVPPKDIEEAVEKIRASTDLVFCYEPIGSVLRHPNNFVFFHDYSALFEGMKRVFYREYENDLIARGFKSIER